MLSCLVVCRCQVKPRLQTVHMSLPGFLLSFFLSNTSTSKATVERPKDHAVRFCVIIVIIRLYIPGEHRASVTLRLPTCSRVCSCFLSVQGCMLYIPGKPRCSVTSRLPTSTPSSKALVAATAHSCPSCSAASISRRSCSNRLHIIQRVSSEKDERHRPQLLIMQCCLFSMLLLQ